MMSAGKMTLSKEEFTCIGFLSRWKNKFTPSNFSNFYTTYILPKFFYNFYILAGDSKYILKLKDHRKVDIIIMTVGYLEL